MNNLITYLMLFFVSTFFVVGTSVIAEQNNQQIPLEVSITSNGIDKLMNSISSQSREKKINDDNDNRTGNILSLVEDLIGTIQIALFIMSFLVTVGISGLIKWVFKTQKEIKKEQMQAHASFESTYGEIKQLLSDAEDNFQKLSFKAEEEFTLQSDEINILATKAQKKLKETENHLRELDAIDELTSIKISAIQNTLIRCLERIPDRNKAFAIYTKLLAAYEILLKDPLQNITPEIREEMEMKAMLIQGNEQYVPKNIIKYMKRQMNLPDSVCDILWGKV